MKRTVSVAVVLCLLFSVLAMNVSAATVYDQVKYTKSFTDLTGWESRSLHNGTTMQIANNRLQATDWTGVALAFSKSGTGGYTLTPGTSYRYEVDMVGPTGGSEGNSGGILFNYNPFGEGNSNLGTGYWLYFEGGPAGGSNTGGVRLYNLNWALWSPVQISRFPNFQTNTDTTKHISITWEVGGHIVVTGAIGDGEPVTLFDLVNTSYAPTNGGNDRIGVLSRMCGSPLSYNNVKVSHGREVADPDPVEYGVVEDSAAYSVTADTVSVEASITKGEGDAVAFAVAYDAAGNMVGVSNAFAINDSTVLVDGAAAYAESFAVTGSVSKVKVFVWSSKDTPSPVCKSAACTLQ